MKLDISHYNNIIFLLIVHLNFELKNNLEKNSYTFDVMKAFIFLDAYKNVEVIIDI